MICTAFSTILFLAAKEKNYGDIFRVHITNLLTSLAGFAFVDDADLLQNKHTAQKYWQE